MRCHRHPLRTRIRSRSVAESTPYVPSRNAETYKASNRRSFANAASGKTTPLAQNAKARLKTPRARLSSGHVNIRSTAMPGVPTTSLGRCASIRRAWSMRTIRTIRQKRTARAPWSRVKVITWCGEGARQESFSSATVLDLDTITDFLETQDKISPVPDFKVVNQKQ